MANLGTAPVEENFKALLRYVEKLTYTPSAMTQEDADAVFAAGWSEKALSDAICVCAHFNMVNRLVEGHGAGRHHTRDPMRKAAELVAEKGYPSLVFGD